MLSCFKSAFSKRVAKSMCIFLTTTPILGKFQANLNPHAVIQSFGEKFLFVCLPHAFSNWLLLFLSNSLSLSPFLLNLCLNIILNFCAGSLISQSNWYGRFQPCLLGFPRSVFDLTLSVPYVFSFTEKSSAQNKYSVENASLTHSAALKFTDTVLLTHTHTHIYSS